MGRLRPRAELHKLASKAKGEVMQVVHILSGGRGVCQTPRLTMLRRHSQCVVALKVYRPELLRESPPSPPSHPSPRLIPCLPLWAATVMGL